MKAKGAARICPACGFDESFPPASQIALPCRTFLHRQYWVGRVLGKPGGFGITYLAWDTGLDTPVAIKEYFPRSLAGREALGQTVRPHSGEDGKVFAHYLQAFLKEAKTLARFDHPHIVKPRHVFEENGTAYLVMDYLEGETLEDHLLGQPGQRVAAARALEILLPVMEGLELVHEQGFIHRDIKPLNIYLTRFAHKRKERPILLDFGAARVSLSGQSRSLSVMYTPDYAAPEQEHARGQGAWTDVYGLAATLYRMVIGVPPLKAGLRLLGDLLDDPRRSAPELTDGFAEALLQGLTLIPRQRPQTVEAFRSLLTAPGIDAPLPGVAAPVPVAQADAAPPSASADPDGTIPRQPQAERPQPQASSPAPARVESPPAPAMPVKKAPEKPSPAGRASDDGLVARSERKTANAAAELDRRVPGRESPGQAQRWRAGMAVGALVLIAAAGALGYRHWPDPEPPRSDPNPAIAKPEKPPALPAAEKPEPVESAPEAPCPYCPAMVQIPAGEFMMGSNDGDSDEKPVHRVSVKAFAIGKHEVTQGQWRAVMGGNPSGFPDCGDDCPVERVSWHDAQDYIAKLNAKTGGRYRLPTEAEWEYACRAGGTQEYCGSGDPDAAAWHSGNSGGKTHPAGGKRANAWGLHDMSGNVWEWTCSAYTAGGYDGSEKTCTNDASARRATRGGSWNHGPRDVRSANRNWVDPARRDDTLGFRLAQD
jgi:formylglycine-generating enzyme required for sulfatase activity/serine/threonine protein kinase